MYLDSADSISPAVSDIQNKSNSDVSLGLDSYVPAVESISLSLSASTINVSETTQATVIASYDNGTSVDVSEQATISLDNGSVATVDNETISGVAAGSVEVEAAFDGVNATETLTVEEAPIPDFESFTAYGTQGQISIGSSLTQTLSSCQFSEPWPANKSAECISVIGSANTSNGTYVTEPTPGVNFPAVMAMDIIPVQINVPNGFSGQLNPETGQMTVNGPVEVLIAPYAFAG
ncbi:MAG: hypothetical protein U5K37_01445 [Natrialbaceae archaeon]|nr:hypothetical protein [Natrialbaceae archaeon]